MSKNNMLKVRVGESRAPLRRERGDENSCRESKRMCGIVFNIVYNKNKTLFVHNFLTKDERRLKSVEGHSVS